VAPKGAFVVYAGIPGSDFEQTPHLFLLDAAGNPTGKPVPSQIGAVAGLAVSPTGDWVAASSERGWLSLFAVDRAGPTLRLEARATFGVSADRTFTYAFRPDGGIATMTDDWVAIFRTPDGAIQKVLDLKTVNRGLEPIGRDISGLFRLRWSPRGDRFTVSWGGGPMFTRIFDATGRQLNTADDLLGTDVAYIDGGDAAIVFGMTAPAVVRMAGLASKPFGGPEISVARLVALSGGRRILTLDGDRVALWSSEGKQLIAPTGFLNYVLDGAAAGADSEAIVAALRSGWVDLFTKRGEFVRRVQFGLRGAGDVAISADCTIVAAFDGTEISTLIRPTAMTWRAAMPGTDLGHQFIAIAGNGSRVLAAGPDNTVRTWSHDGGDARTYKLAADGQTLGRPHGLAVSSESDTIVVTDVEAAWFARSADGRVRRVELPGQPRVVVPLARGFAFGLADGRIVRLGRDGVPEGEPIKGSEFGGVGQIAVANDGQSFMVVEDDQVSVRQLDWNGQVLAGPFRTSHPDRIRGVFFDSGRAMLILSQERSNGFAGDGLALKPLLGSPAGGLKHFERPR
jgi:WD40 repeat protein